MQVTYNMAEWPNTIDIRRNGKQFGVVSTSKLGLYRPFLCVLFGEGSEMFAVSMTLHESQVCENAEKLALLERAHPNG